MDNPFEQLDKRLFCIEALLLDIKSQLQNPVSTPDENDEILTVEKTAKFLSLTVPTIYSKVSRGELPVMKRGHRLYFSQQDLLNYLKLGRIKTNDEISDETDEYLIKRRSVLNS